MGSPKPFEIWVHWDYWCLPLGVALNLRGQEFNLHVGPIAFCVNWSADALASASNGRGK